VECGIQEKEDEKQENEAGVENSPMEDWKGLDAASGAPVIESRVHNA